MVKAAPHMTPEELVELREWKGESPNLSPNELWKMHKKSRRANRKKPLCLTAFRNVLCGRSYNHAEETRGRKRKLGSRAVAALDKKRRELVKKNKGQFEVPWDEIIKKARVKKVHATTARHALVNAGIAVARRPCREKPQRNQEHMEERAETCRRWRFLPDTYFNDDVDLIIDNKHWEVPTTEVARVFKNKSRVRFQNRIPGEGLEPQYTKPNAKRNRKNLGGALLIAAGIRNDRVVMWKSLDTKWNGDAAAALYRNDIAKVLRRCAPTKARPMILEDNDPTGYKSGKARAEKQELGYKVMVQPRFSPDLNPLDFFLWNNIQTRMARSDPKKGKESVDKYKARLRNTAMSTSRPFLRKAIASIKERAQAIYDAGGENIDLD